MLRNVSTWSNCSTRGGLTSLGQNGPWVKGCAPYTRHMVLRSADFHTQRTINFFVMLEYISKNTAIIWVSFTFSLKQQSFSVTLARFFDYLELTWKLLFARRCLVLFAHDDLQINSTLNLPNQRYRKSRRNIRSKQKIKIVGKRGLIHSMVFNIVNIAA